MHALAQMFSFATPSALAAGFAVAIVLWLVAAEEVELRAGVTSAHEG